MSLANFDIEQLGRGLIAIVYFVIPAFVALGIFGWAERKIKHIKWNRRKNVKEVTLPVEDEFFFGAIKDWRTMK